MLRRIDDTLARGEGAVAAGVVFVMLVVAFVQASLRNLTQFGWGWANEALQWLSWGDFVLQKGTLWLAFLGASLAVHANKHVAIDFLPRFLGPRGRTVLRGLLGIIGAVIGIFLVRAFFQAVLLNGHERPPDMEILAAEGPVHVCDATAAQLEGSEVQPGLFCVLRSALTSVGAPMETLEAAVQLIVPVALALMTIRMLGHGLYALFCASKGKYDKDEDPGASTAGPDEVEA